VRSSILAVALVLGVALTAACKKTGEGEYEIERPVVGTETDTVQTPSVDVGTQQDTVVITTPTVDVDAAGNADPDN
jgi:outer membrane protein assembly factor BamE (lipoprotein component of BamABCDE complex)